MSRTLLLTRARAQAEEFAANVLQKTDFQCHIAPMQEMQDIPVNIDFSGVDALVFTSKNGVDSFAQRWNIPDIPVFCVGPATADRARALGMSAHAAAGNSQSLAALINAANVQNPLHIHGLHKAADLAIQGQSIAIYDQISVALDAQTLHILAGGIDAVALFSPRSARLLAQVWHPDWPRPVFYCISPATAKPVAGLGTTRICANPSAESLLALLST